MTKLFKGGAQSNNINFVIVFIILINICISCINKNERVDNIKEEKINKKKPIYKYDSIDFNSGCPGFILHKKLENFDNIDIIVKAKSELIQTGKYYNINIGDALYDSLLFDIYIDVYKSKNIFHKSYCDDLIIENTETPTRIKCISGNIIFYLQPVENEYKEVITLSIFDLKIKQNKFIKNLNIPKIEFKRVVISSWGG